MLTTVSDLGQCSSQSGQESLHRCRLDPHRIELPSLGDSHLDLSDGFTEQEHRRKSVTSEKQRVCHLCDAKCDISISGKEEEGTHQSFQFDGGQVSVSRL